MLDKFPGVRYDKGIRKKVVRKRSTSAAPPERISHRLKGYPGKYGWKVAFEPEF